MKSGHRSNYGAYGKSNDYQQDWNNDDDDEDSDSSIIIHAKHKTIETFLSPSLISIYLSLSIINTHDDESRDDQQK